ncbi:MULTISPECIES: hypothetical protein [unclassified Bradyrhizobium]
MSWKKLGQAREGQSNPVKLTFLLHCAIGAPSTKANGALIAPLSFSLAPFANGAAASCAIGAPLKRG